jgi:site-specific DNA-methyltransferase (adenine-specific)
MPQMTMGERDMMMKKYQSNIWGVAPVMKMRITGENVARHEAPFPKGIVAPLVWAYSDVDDVVVDPFCGTGTTLRVAYEYRRRYLGIEISKDYVDLIKRNMSQMDLFGEERTG